MGDTQESSKASAGLTFQARNSMTIRRRDGTIEEYPGEWSEPMSEEEAKVATGNSPGFVQWLKSKREEVLNGSGT